MPGQNIPGGITPVEDWATFTADWDFEATLRRFREAAEQARAERAARNAALPANTATGRIRFAPAQTGRLMGQQPEEVEFPLDRPPQPAPVVEPVVFEEDHGKLVNTFLVGADPEFVIVKDGKLVNTRYYLPRNGEVGYDHNGDCIELRPKPAKGTLTLVKRIQKLIQGEVLKAVTDKGKWRGGALVKAAQRTLTLGGHVHLDVPPPGYTRDPEGSKLQLKALDRLTLHLEKLDVLPGNESAERRALGQYGQWGAYRDQTDQGGTPHLEYRTMASWLNHPVTAFVCLTGAKLATVAPQVALDTLRYRNVNAQNLVNFFEFFRHKDLNARQVLEKLMDGQDIKAIQKDPDGDMKEAWKEMAFAA